MLLNYFFHFNVRPPLRVRHTIGLAVLIMLFSQARLTATLPQSNISDLVTFCNFKLTNTSVSNVKSYMFYIYELKVGSLISPYSHFIVDGLVSKSNEDSSYLTIDPLFSSGSSEIYVSKSANLSNLSFFKPIILMSIFYFFITVGKLIYKGFFRIKKF